MAIGHSVKWSYISEIASKAVTPLVFIVLARLLTPEDYGVVAAATMVVTLTQVFWESGIGKAVIQFKGDVAETADVGFWLSGALGLAIALILVFSADLIAVGVFRDGRVGGVLRVMSIQVVLSSLATVPVALMQRDMEFKRLFRVRLAATVAPAFLSIPLALGGVGYWALAIGAVAGGAMQLLMLGMVCSWRPRFSFNSELARRLSRFSAWVIVSGLSGWLYLWADSLIVGMHLGARDLGLYRTGNTFVIMIAAVGIAPLLPVLYSYLSRIQHDRDQVRNVLEQVVRGITVVVVPCAFLLAVLAEPLSAIIFGDRWVGIGLVIAIMSLTHGLAWTVGANGEAYRAIGRPDFETKGMAAALPVYCVAYWISVQSGLLAFLWARFAAALFGIVLQLWIAKVALGVSPMAVLAYLAKIVLACSPLLAVIYVRELFAGAWMMEVVAAVCAVAWVGMAIFLLERRGLIPRVLHMARSRRVAS